MKETVAITGASGFIGEHLDRSLSENYNVKKFDRESNSLAHPDTLEELLMDCDIVYHLAAQIRGNDDVLREVNVEGTGNVIKAMNMYCNQAHLIFASSFAVYSTPKSGEVIDEEFQTSPRNVYGSTKLEAEELIVDAMNEGLSASILRLSNVYGIGVPPYQQSVISTFIDIIKNNGELTIHGDGEQTRDFVYIDDVVDLLLKLAATKKNGIFNVCSGEEVSINHILQKISEHFGITPKIKYMYKEDSGGYWVGDNSKAGKVLEWNPKVSFDEGIKRILKDENRNNNT